MCFVELILSSFAGGMYIIAGNLLKPMAEAARTTKLMGMEDVFITGILSEKLRILRVALRGISTEG